MDHWWIRFLRNRAPCFLNNSSSTVNSCTFNIDHPVIPSDYWLNPYLISLCWLIDKNSLGGPFILSIARCRIYNSRKRTLKDVPFFSLLFFTKSTGSLEFTRCFSPWTVGPDCWFSRSCDLRKELLPKTNNSQLADAAQWAPKGIKQTHRFAALLFKC